MNIIKSRLFLCDEEIVHNVIIGKYLMLSIRNNLYFDGAGYKFWVSHLYKNKSVIKSSLILQAFRR